MREMSENIPKRGRGRPPKHPKNSGGGHAVGASGERGQSSSVRGEGPSNEGLNVMPDPLSLHGGGQPGTVGVEEGPRNEDRVNFKRPRGRPRLDGSSSQVRRPRGRPRLDGSSSQVRPLYKNAARGRKRTRPNKKSNTTSQERLLREDDGENIAKRKRTQRVSKKRERQPPTSRSSMKPIEEGECSKQHHSPGADPFLGEDRHITLPAFDYTGHSDEEEVDREKIKGSGHSVGHLRCPSGEARFMAGPLNDLGPIVKCQYSSNRLQRITEFCEQHSVDRRAHLVVLNVPSGTAVYGVESTVTPPWNVVSPSFITHGMLVASHFLSKTGWLVCIYTTAQEREVEDAASAEGFRQWRSFTLLSSHPVYCQTGHPNFIYTLIVSVFHREGENAKPNYLNAGKVGHGECSLSRDTMVEKVDPNEWRRMEDGRPWRGGAERASCIWRFIILTFSRFGDSLIDLVAGTGTLVMVASQLGRHALGIESDHLILDQLLKPSEFVIPKD